MGVSKLFRSQTILINDSTGYSPGCHCFAEINDTGRLRKSWQMDTNRLGNILINLLDAVLNLDRLYQFCPYPMRLIDWNAFYSQIQKF